MIATIRSEWIKLRTVRSHVVLAIVAAAFPLIITLLTVSLIKEFDIGSDTLVQVLVNSSRVSSMMLGVLGVMSITGEFTYNTIRPTLAATPNRLRVLTAKAVVAAVAATVVMALILAAGYAAGSVIVDSRFSGLGSFDETSGMIGGMMVFNLLYAVACVGIGALLRNQGAAISLLIVWPLIAEPLLGTLFERIGATGLVNYLPFNAGFRLVEPFGNGDFGRVPSGLVFGGFALLILAAGAWALSRRDA